MPLHDVAVIGAGHNGLVAAAYLARAGLRTLVLERRPIVGGACVTETFHPGFRASTLAYACGLLRPQIKEDLQLTRFGLEEHPFDPSQFLPFPDGRYLLYRADPQSNEREVAKFSKADARALAKYEHFWRVFAESMEPFLLAPPVPLEDLPARVRGREAEDVVKRALSFSAADLLDDFFESEEVKVSLATGALAGTLAGPRTPGTAFVMGYHGLGTIAGQRGVWGWARGGMGAISESIARAARHFGAEIRTGVSVARIVVKDGRATGVELTSGERIPARVVVSNADPKRTFLGLVGPDRLPSDFVRDVRNIRMESSSFKLNLALRELPDFRAIPGAKLQAHHRGIIDLAPTIDYLERAYEDAKSGRPSREPFPEIVIESANDSGAAPPGMHTLTASVKFAPFELATGSWATEGEPFSERILDTMEGYAPNLRRAIVARDWWTPLAMEQEFGLTRGDVFHGSILPPQVLSGRPVVGWSRYRTPVERLYMCSAGTHPGGGVIGAPGHNAAMAVLEDWPALQDT